MGTGPTPAPPTPTTRSTATQPGLAGEQLARSSAARARLRWLLLLEVANLLLDVLTPFLALYLVAVEHVAPSVAALAVAVRLGPAWPAT